MAKSDQSRASGSPTFSWENGSLNTSPISAQGINSGLRGDLQTAYLRGPSQTEYVGMSDNTRNAMDSLYSSTASNRGPLHSAIGYHRNTVESGGLTPGQNDAIRGLLGTVGGYQGIADAGGWNDTMRSALSGAQGLLSRYQGIASGDGLNPALRGVQGDVSGIADRFMSMAGGDGLSRDQRAAMAGVKDARSKYSDMYDRGAAGNPYLDDIVRQTNDATYADMMASLGSSGAIGSNLHMKELGGALADNESRLRYQDYGDSFARQGNALAGMMGADSSLFGMGQTGVGNRQSALSGAMGAQGLLANIGQYGSGNVNNALGAMTGLNANIGNLGQTALANYTGALSGIQGAHTGAFNMRQAGAANAANSAAALPGLYDAISTPERIRVAQSSAIDADRQQQAAFDPYLNHIAQYQGLLGANTAGPQPATARDWIGLLLGGVAGAAGGLLG